MSFFSRKRHPSQGAAQPQAPSPSQTSPLSREAHGQPAPPAQMQAPPQSLNQSGPPPRPNPPPPQNSFQPTPAQPPQSQQQPPSTAPPRPPNYPWSAKRLNIGPIKDVLRPGQPSQNIPSPSPFPRYGHSLPPICNANGDMFLFGGLVHEAVHNDLYSFSARDLTASLVHTVGEVPPPRVGHASALVSSVLIVWGGDTKTNDGEKQDDGLYLLNLGPKEWTRVTTHGATPAGRYGHAVTMCGTKFFIFGGQVDGEFLNDLWAFDLNSLKTSPTWEELKPAPGTEAPARRTGHVMVTFGDKLYLFGGTDGQYHYNDTWSYDVNTRSWKELTCIGYIPAPREGHAAALVDDVMYVFGGRGVDGKDLGDLSAFKISNQRWYMFQNMGPAPSGRSGHAMASAGSKVFVLGGESFTTPRPDDPGMIHVLDTKNIKYPDSKNAPPTSGPGTGRRPSVQQQGRTVTSPPPQQGQQQQQPGHTNGMRAMSPPGNSPMGSDTEDTRRAMTSPTGGRPPPNGVSMQPFPTPAASRAKSPVTQQQPSKLRARDDDGYPSQEDATSSESHTMRTGQARDRAASPDQVKARTTSPIPVSARAASPRATSPVNANGPPTQTTVQHPSIANTVSMSRNARSPSPVVAAAAPPDAFYYPGSGAKSPTPLANGYSPNGHSKIGSGGNISADLLRDLKAKDAELNSARKKETWMRAALAKANKGGFVWAGVDLDRDSGDWNEDGSETSTSTVADSVLRLKQERARIQAVFTAQAQAVSERFAEAERARNGALQEAAFYRAKLSAYESNSPTEVARLDRDRCTELERQLAQVMAERDAQDHRVLELNESAAAQAKLLEEAEERAADATHRAELLEDVHSRTTADHAELQHKHAATESALRDHQDRVLSLSSLAQQHEAEQSSVLSQLEEFKASRDQNMRALEQIRIAVTAADARAEEADAQLRRATAQISRLEGEVHDTRAELEARSHECDVATARLADVENAWTKSREEADAFRAATTSGLGELLDTHRDLRADEDRAVRGHAEKVKAMEMESTSLRKMLKEAGIRVDEAQANLADHRKRAQNLESDQITLRSQLAGLRSQLADATAEAARLRKEISVRDSELREKSKVASEADVRLGMLRNVLADRGIIIDEKDIGSKASDASATRIAELETQLADSERHYDELERDMKEALRQKQTAVEKVDALSTQLDRARTSSRTPDSGSLAAAEARANEAERKLALSEQHHKERLQQVEYDYQMAISYVKGTEKMLRRMKDELTKQKALNNSLQGELDAARGVSGTEAGARTRNANGRNTPVADDGNGADGVRAQLLEAQRQTQRVTAENQDLQRRLETLQRDVETLKDKLVASQRESDRRLSHIEELEGDLERLEASLAVARNGHEESLAEQLTAENTSLKRENEILSHKIGILLDMGQSGFDRTGERPLSSGSQGDGHSSSESAMHFEQFPSDFEDWQRKVGTHGSHRPLSEYDVEPPLPIHERAKSRS